MLLNDSHDGTDAFTAACWSANEQWYLQVFQFADNVSI